MLRQGMRTSSIFNSQHVATRRNRVAKRAQHVAPNNVAICCVEMFWLGLANTGPTMLRYVALNCCHRLAGALQPRFLASRNHTTVQPSLFPKLRCIEHLGRFVRKVYNVIYRINHYPADGVVRFVNAYPPDSDLSGG